MDDRDDRVNFVAIIWKRSQTVETIGTIEGYPRIITAIPVIENKFAVWTKLKSKKKTIQKCSHHVWALFEIR